MVFPYFFLFALGLAFGSFLNVAALRYEPGRGVFHRHAVGGRSKCLHCMRALAWYELVPLVSYVFLRRKCRTCRGLLSLQYPFVELLSGALFAALPFFFARFFNTGDLFFFRPELLTFYLFTLAWLAALWVLLLISVIDIHHFLIPDGLNLALGALGAAVIYLKTVGGAWLLPLSKFFVKNFALLVQPFATPLASHLFGAVVVTLLFWLMVVFTKGRGMGFGDVKLAFALGLILGWPDVMLMTVFAFVLGGIWGSFLVFGRGKTMKTKLPFAPFMALGAALTVFFGHTIVGWYFLLFRI